MIAPVGLAALLTSCAPSVSPDTMQAIVEVESGGNEFSLYDNSTRRSYAPRTYADALAIAQSLIAQRHSVDVGLAQINSGNFAGYRTDAAHILWPCQNLIIASSILANSYATAQAAFPEVSVALYHAIGAYNTGSIHAGDAYVAKVVAAATVPSIAILTRQPSPWPTTSRRPNPEPTPRGTPTPSLGPWHGTWGTP